MKILFAKITNKLFGFQWYFLFIAQKWILRRLKKIGDVEYFRIDKTWVVFQDKLRGDYVDNRRFLKINFNKGK